MSERNWQDCFLTDIIEAQLVLFLHLSAALNQAGILPRTVSAETLRRAAGRKDVRPGLACCVRNYADLLEQAAAQQAGWHPKVVPGGGRANAAAGEDDKGGAPRPSANGQAGNGQAGNGQAANGWPPRLVDDDPDGA
jgi:hypothetical protein